MLLLISIDIKSIWLCIFTYQRMNITFLLYNNNMTRMAFEYICITIVTNDEYFFVCCSLLNQTKRFSHRLYWYELMTNQKAARGEHSSLSKLLLHILQFLIKIVMKNYVAILVHFSWFYYVTTMMIVLLMMMMWCWYLYFINHIKQRIQSKYRSLISPFWIRWTLFQADFAS